MYYSFRHLKGRLRSLIYDIRGLAGTLGFFGDYNPPLFLVGTPNSGTTIFAHGIAAHPEIHYGSNASVLWDKNALSRQEDALITAEDVSESYKRRIRGNFAYYQWRNSEKIIMNRNARNSFRIHCLKSVFPESVIVHIVRDGRAVVRSNYQGYDGYRDTKDEISHAFDKFVIPPNWQEWKNRHPIEQYAFMWNETSLYASQEGKKYDEDYLEVKYEDLPEHGEDILSEIWAKVGLNPTRYNQNSIPEFENRNHKWRNELSSKDVEMIHEVAEEGLHNFNYINTG